MITSRHYPVRHVMCVCCFPGSAQVDDGTRDTPGDVIIRPWQHDSVAVEVSDLQISPAKIAVGEMFVVRQLHDEPAGMQTGGRVFKPVAIFACRFDARCFTPRTVDLFGLKLELLSFLNDEHRLLNSTQHCPTDSNRNKRKTLIITD